MTDTNAAELSFTGCKPISIGMVLYPGFTLLDLAGPQTAFGLNGRTHLLWKNMEPVPTDMGVSMNPTATFANAPDNLDVIFVPGGFGTIDAMQNQELIDFPGARGQDRSLRHLGMHRLRDPRHGRTARWLSGSNALAASMRHWRR